MSNSSRNTFKGSINNYDEEFEDAIEEAIDRFAQHNIRIRTPNRKIGPMQRHKLSKIDLEAS